jgi:hypothetical protein
MPAEAWIALVTALSAALTAAVPRLLDRFLPIPDDRHTPLVVPAEPERVDRL